MKIKRIATLLAAPLILLCACQDDLSSQGSSLVTGEVSIIVDSIPTRIEASCVEYDTYDSKSTSHLLGNINVPEYGSLSCSFLSQLYPSPVLGINDTVPEAYIDSMRMVIQVPRGAFTGDSIAPQQLKVWKLNRAIPSDIANNANPTDYYDPSDPDALIGSKSYTLSGLEMSDSALIKDKFVYIRFNIPREKALECVRRYRTDPSIFQWPATFAQNFPGIYVEQNFGNGCIGRFSYFGIFLYYRTDKTVSTKDPETGELVSSIQTKRDSVCLFSSAPEVLSSNVINFNPASQIKTLAAQGKAVVTSPGGYYVDIDFPAKEIIEKYNANQSSLTVISSLGMKIPVSKINNDFNIGPAPFLLMVKKSEREKFFAENRIPDGVTSFRAPYDEETKSYSFSALRPYIMSLINSGEEITADDNEFSLVPVSITTETETNSYTGATTTYVTGCSNYIAGPTMAVLDTDNVIIKFTYSKQEIE